MQKNVKAHTRATFTLISRLLALSTAVLLLSAPYPALGQSTYGNFVGTISDSSGAVVQNATITVTQTSTDESRTATSDARGDFSLVNLNAGVY